jgi:hypothetical protein
MYLVSAAVLGEKVPPRLEKVKGPAALKSKDDYIKYLKGAVAYSHKAMRSLTPRQPDNDDQIAF